jgi:hypothetical protein
MQGVIETRHGACARGVVVVVKGIALIKFILKLLARSLYEDALRVVAVVRAAPAPFI